MLQAFPKHDAKWMDYDIEVSDMLLYFHFQLLL